MGSGRACWSHAHTCAVLSTTLGFLARDASEGGERGSVPSGNVPYLHAGRPGIALRSAGWSQGPHAARWACVAGAIGGGIRAAAHGCVERRLRPRFDGEVVDAPCRPLGRGAGSEGERWSGRPSEWRRTCACVHTFDTTRMFRGGRALWKARGRRERGGGEDAEAPCGKRGAERRRAWLRSGLR